MGMRINTNVDAASASRNVGMTQALLSRSLQQLASGRRINSAADDAAGLAISESLNTQARGLGQAARNAQDGISLIQTADGALAQTHDTLQRIRELTVQAGNGTLGAEQRGSIQAEIDALRATVDQTAQQTQFNNQPLLDGSNPGVTLQVGANSGSSETATVDLPNATSTALGVGPGQVDVSSPAAANASLANVDQAIDRVSQARGTLGAQQSALQNVTASINVSAENQISAQSRIRDLDVAQGVAARTRDSILADLGTAVLAQANFSRQTVLRLLG